VTGWQPSERRGEDGRFLTLVPPAGPSYVKMQAVPGPAGLHLDLDHVDRPAAVEHARTLGAATAWVHEDVEVMRSRAHPDMATADREADTATHVGLGAELVGVHAFWTVLAAPGGQVYCLTDRDPTTGVVRTL
jgi:hypothetical protein